MSGVTAAIDSLGLEIIIPALLLLVAVLPFLLNANRNQALGLLAAPFLLTLGLGYLKYQADHAEAASEGELLRATPAQVRLSPDADPGNAYTSSQTCRACHPGEYDSWHKSYHRTMTQLAKPDAVLAKWHGTELPLGQARLHLEKKGDEYWVTTVGADGIKQAVQRLTMTTGSHHLQVYWVGDKAGNMQHPFPYGWLIADQKWAPVEDTFLRNPHGAPVDAKWNKVCIECHSVAGKAAVSMTRQGQTARTEVAELGISCEACHGPAREHIAHFQNPFNRYTGRDEAKAAHGIKNPDTGKMDHRKSAQVCGQCHSYQFTPNPPKRLAQGPSFLPGGDLNAAANAVAVQPSKFTGAPPKSQAEARQFAASHGHPHPGGEWLTDRFWPDGIVRVTGREYNGLLDTPCFQRGKMSCLSCHSMHGYHDRNDQLAPRMETNQACTQCHEDIRENLTAHTKHAADSAGSSCYNCHMPHTTYGLLSAIRSHQIDSPSVATQLKTGRVNACNLCHINQSLSWTNEHLAEWYKHKPAELNTEAKRISSVLEMLLKGDAGQRAIAAWHMGWEPARQASGGDWQAGWLLRTLNDPYSAVRYIAHKALQADPRLAKAEFDYAAPLAKRTTQIQKTRTDWEKQLPEQTGVAQQIELLIDGQGKPIEAEARRLEARRNNRPMTLQE